jgi:hypothetical protein
MRKRTWTPAPDLLDEWNALTDIEKAAVELAVYSLSEVKPIHYPQPGTMERQLIDSVMELPIARKLAARKHQLAVA